MLLEDTDHQYYVAQVSENKGVLAATFESTNSIRPLWEDRYVEQGTVVGLESWKEKKAMKQFRAKLQMATLDGASHETVVKVKIENIVDHRAQVENSCMIGCLLTYKWRQIS